MIFNQHKYTDYEYYLTVDIFGHTNLIVCSSHLIKILSLENQIILYKKYFTEYAKLPEHLVKSNLIEKL